MSYTFDGKKLKEKNRSTTLWNVNGDKIRKGTSSSTYANVSGDKIRKGTSSSTAFNVSGGKLRKGTSSSTWMKMKDIEKEIAGHTSDSMRAALWLCIHNYI